MKSIDAYSAACGARHNFCRRRSIDRQVIVLSKFAGWRTGYFPSLTVLYGWPTFDGIVQSKGMNVRGHRRRLTIAVSSALLTILSTGVVGTGAAMAAEAEPAVEVARIDRAEILRSAIRGSQLEKVSATTRTRVKSHLESAARQGRLVSAADVRVATLPDPFAAGETIDLVWTGQAVPQQALLAQADHGDDGIQFGLGVAMAEEQSPTLTRADAPPATKSSSGYGGFADVQNMYTYSNDCLTVWFNPRYVGGQQHQLVSCYEKMAQSRTRHWIYNRWGMFTVGQNGFPGSRTEVVDFTLRSRPWSGQESKVTRLNKWVPEGPSQNCSTTSPVQIGGVYGGVTGMIAIPINQCTNIRVFANSPTNKAIGVDWDGVNRSQVRLDIAGDYDASDAVVVPSWADYSWAEVHSCPNIGVACSVHGQFTKELWSQIDSGW
ncbi:hypothetical protein ACQP2X_30615 [Actinoplanes sp. CA-131856]